MSQTAEAISYSRTVHPLFRIVIFDSDRQMRKRPRESLRTIAELEIASLPLSLFVFRIKLVHGTMVFPALCYPRLRCIMAPEVSDSQPVCVSRCLSYSRVPLCNVNAPPNVWYYHITRFLLLLSCSPRSLCPPISCLFLRWIL